MNNNENINARKFILNNLDRIENDGAYVDRLDNKSLPPEVARRVKALTAGVTRWRRWLDFIIDKSYKGKKGSMVAGLRQILRLAIYELLKLEKPPHAVINEAVKLTKQRTQPHLGKVTNGILRNIDRNRAKIEEPRTGNHINDLSIKFSHPTWMVKRWKERYGWQDTEALLNWNNTAPTFGIRVNTLKISMASFKMTCDAFGLKYRTSEYLDDMLVVDSMGPLLAGGFLERGLCAVQDESAAMVVKLLDAQPGERIIDTCSAPGGKTLNSAMRMNNEGEILALDSNERRLEIVASGAETQGVSIIKTAVHNFTEEPTSFELADRVLVDVPCAGLGVLSRRADARWHRSPENLIELMDLQDKILDNASKLVKSGGYLVYSTCTIEPDENQDRIFRFLETHPDFKIAPGNDLLPAEVLSPEGFLSTFPPAHKIDGAFGAKLIRQ